jgi:signal peptidase I
MEADVPDRPLTGSAAEEPAILPPRPPRKGWLRECLDALLVALVFAVLARTWVVQAFKIPTGSMEANLLVGDHILVNKFIYGPVRYPIERLLLPVRTPRRGDVVVFKYPEDPERDFIKRCIGLPGDEVEIRNKVLYLDGERVEEGAYTHFTDPNTYPESPFVPEHYQVRDQFGPAEVPADEYFCLGDNRDNSHDSRFWGAVPEANLKGRALLVYWSVVADPGEVDPEGPERGIWQRLGDALREETRWERTFSLVR